MLLVKTKIGPSKIHGIGLFAAEFIRKGTPIWQFKSGFDQEFSQEDLGEMSQPSREQVLHYCYIDPARPDRYILCFDDARFYNHSENPNTVTTPDDKGGAVEIAARDIHAGEEITYNYKTGDADYYRKFGIPKIE